MVNTTIPDLSPAVWVGLGILAAVSLGLLVAAVIAVIRTPEDGLPEELSRVAWILICLVQFAGPIAFFVLRARHRREASRDEAMPEQLDGSIEPPVPVQMEGKERSGTDTQAQVSDSQGKAGSQIRRENGRQDNRLDIIGKLYG
ncbi:PLDc N-terminal domain-containing protein [Flaviflexus massiliensis]|uniref:PLDc N-terminal domain-containing protein n=1 Tax=Flaviflexus massiliensis TaxID=1522309 RepID=UPI00164DBD21|nr:PLDc N-terminal domain-containing protein [Flaviflexus massiliensis]